MLIHYRQKDDPYNAIFGGFITGGLLSIRGGASIAFKQAMIGGVILLIIEGVQNIYMAISIR
jgi:import inner membrane translocase subunit TIM17